MAEYDEAVTALFARRPGRLVRGTDRIHALADLLDNPQRRYPVVHITGTNGKTSVARIVTALLYAYGLRVGTYTSPHLQDVRERVRVDGRQVARETFLGLLAELQPVLDEVEYRHGELVTFFETMTALAYLHFARERVDVAAVEVGMGGRLDATNIADGRIAVIGPVGLDHPELGSTLEQIAAEKAGIVKPGAVAVSARQEPGAAAMISESARHAGARLLVDGSDFEVRASEPVGDGQRLHLRGPYGPVRDAFLPLAGPHQARNALLGLAAAETFLGGPLPAEVVRAGLTAVRSPGRLELVRRSDVPDVLLDGAHNAAAARSLAAAVQSDFADRYPDRVLVLGVLGDKDIDGIASALAQVTDRVVLVSPPSVRAGSLDRLAAAVRAAGHEPAIADDVPAALDHGSALTGPQTGLIVVTGSLYVVGAARTALGLSAT